MHVLPKKYKKHRICLTVGVNLIVCLFDVSAPTSDLTTAKILFNSVNFTPRAHFVTLDLKNFYLGTPLPEARYMRMKLDILPNGIIEKDTLRNIVNNRWVYFRLKKRNVGHKRGRRSIQQAPQITHEYIWILQVRLHAWIIKTSLAAHHVQPRHGWFWCEVWRHPTS